MTWLHAQYHQDLVQQIKHKNRIRGFSAVDARLIQRLPAFVACTSYWEHIGLAHMAWHVPSN